MGDFAIYSQSNQVNWKVKEDISVNVQNQNVSQTIVIVFQMEGYVELNVNVSIAKIFIQWIMDRRQEVKEVANVQSHNV